MRPERNGAIPEPTAPPAPPAPVDDCNAAGLATTISEVTFELSDYFALNPDANQAPSDALAVLAEV